MLTNFIIKKIFNFYIFTFPLEFKLRLSRRFAHNSFNKFSKKSKRYREIISGVDNFEDVEVISKESFFKKPYSEIISDQLVSNTETVLISSGTSGNFSLGFKDKNELLQAQRSASWALMNYYSTDKKKSAIINTLPMGSKVYSNLTTFDVGPHLYRAIAAIEVAHELNYEQIFLVSLGHIFLKQFIEEIVSMLRPEIISKIYFLTGGDHFPEAVRTYYYRKLGSLYDNEDRPRVVNSGGVTELLVNSLFFETPSLIKIRRLIHTNKKFKAAFFEYFNLDINYTPALFFWDPMDSYIETKDNKIVITCNKSSTLIPLVKYQLDDNGIIDVKERLNSLLENFHYEDLKYKEKLPLMIYLGRNNVIVKEIQDIIYEDEFISNHLSGNFFVRDNQIEFQLIKDLKMENLSFLQAAFSRYTNLTNYEFHFYEYLDFKYNMNLNFENKIRYS